MHIRTYLPQCLHLTSEHLFSRGPLEVLSHNACSAKVAAHVEANWSFGPTGVLRSARQNDDEVGHQTPLGHVRDDPFCTSYVASCNPPEHRFSKQFVGHALYVKCVNNDMYNCACRHDSLEDSSIVWNLTKINSITPQGICCMCLELTLPNWNNNTKPAAANKLRIMWLNLCLVGLTKSVNKSAYTGIHRIQVIVCSNWLS